MRQGDRAADGGPRTEKAGKRRRTTEVWRQRTTHDGTRTMGTFRDGNAERRGAWPHFANDMVESGENAVFLPSWGLAAAEGKI
eukprot:9778203-Prorocentrum_lima.AAC.1